MRSVTGDQDERAGCALVLSTIPVRPCSDHDPFGRGVYVSHAREYRSMLGSICAEMEIPSSTNTSLVRMSRLPDWRAKEIRPLQRAWRHSLMRGISMLQGRKVVERI